MRVFWAHRMLLMTGESGYADVMERALYNGAVSGISLQGDCFFYENRLASRGGLERWIWHRCPCCPANIARLVASLGHYVASVAPGELSVHLYGQSRLAATVDGVEVILRQATRFPWEGNVEITMDAALPVHFALRLRNPEWSSAFSVAVNGETMAPVLDRGYLRIERDWSPGDCVSLSLAMHVRRLSARPELVFDIGRVALQRGPFIYCTEEADVGCDVERLVLDGSATIGTRFEPDLLGGIGTLEVPVLTASDQGWGEQLYRDTAPELKPAMVRAVPYPLWAHRGPGSMAVWLRCV